MMVIMLPDFVLTILSFYLPVSTVLDASPLAPLQHNR